MFEIQTSSEDGYGPSVTLGEQVGERLFFRFRQAFGSQSVSEFILEYQLAEYLRLQTSVAEGGGAQRNLTQRVEQGGDRSDLLLLGTDSRRAAGGGGGGRRRRQATGGGRFGMWGRDFSPGRTTPWPPARAHR